MEIQIIYISDSVQETELCRSFEEAEEKLAVLKSLYQEIDSEEPERIMNLSIGKLI